MFKSIFTSIFIFLIVPTFVVSETLEELGVNIAKKSYGGYEPENILPESKPYRKKTEARAKKRTIEKRKNRQKVRL